MSAILSVDKAPPFEAPLRFFLTAPVFGVLAGVLLACDGGEALASRWSPSALALTHLLTAGFMLQVMLGALIQVLPVVAGASIARSLGVARVVHAAAAAGALLLAAGLRFGALWLLQAGAWLLAAAVLLFLAAAGAALFPVPSTSPTIRGLKLALAALGAVTGLGLVLALALSRGWPLPLAGLTDLHAGWGLGGWAGVLLAAVAYVVVPMFQLTPGYPARPGWLFPVVIIAGLLAWSAAVLSGQAWLGALSRLVLAGAGIAFAVLTLRLQARRRRAIADATYRYWQLGLLAGVAALAMLAAATLVPALARHHAWTPVFGVLLIAGAYLPFMAGMLYKIVPFLSWLHLQQRAKARVPAMNRFLGEAETRRQFRAYVVALALLLGTPLLPWLAVPAGAAGAIACAWLGWNLWSAVRRYRGFLAALPPNPAQGM